jgi:Flp pilus assembly protein TadG
MRRGLTSRLRNRRYDEGGAFAIVFAALVVMLLVLSAFTVDLGQAYVSKRQLQTAADAGALAAAQVYKGQTLTCQQLLSNAPLKTAAQQAADRWAQQNRPNAVGTPVQLGCNAAGGLTVDYSLTGSTPQVFGGLVTGHNTITTQRAAQVTIGGGASDAVGNLRPWGICSAVAKKTGVVAFVPMKNSSTTLQDSATLCGTDAPPGGWWIGQCVGQGNGTGDTKDAIEKGCDPSTAYTFVPNQSTHNTSPTTLFNWMTSQCPNKSSGPYCLSSDTGKNPETQGQASWQTLVGKSFTMPVFCDTPDCSQLAQSGQGNGGSYAVEMIATVQLCGFYMTAPSTGWPTSGACKDNNPLNYTSNSVTNGSGLFVVITALTGGPGNTDYHLNVFNTMSITK